MKRNSRKAALSISAEAARLRKPSRNRRPSMMMVAPLVCLAFLAVCAVMSGVFIPEKNAKPSVQQARRVELVQLIPQGRGDPVSIRLTLDGDSFTLQRTEDGYAFAEEPGRVDLNAARELLGTGSAILSRERLTGHAEDFGLSQPRAVAEYTYEDGTTLTLTLGDPVVTGEGWYAAVSGSEETHIINTSLGRTLTLGRGALYALPDMTEYFTANTLLEAAITPSGGETVTIARVTEQNPWGSVAELTTPIRYPANAERAADIYLALEALQPTGVANADGEDAAWGLDDPLAVIRLKDKKTITLTLGMQGEQATMRIGGDSAVYTVDASSLNFLQHVTVPYLAEQLPGLMALSEVSALTVTAGDERYRMTMDAAGGHFTLQGKSVDRDAFVDMYQQLIGLLIERYAPQRGASAQPRVSFEYTLRDGGTWTISFLPWDEDYDLILRDGCAAFLISRSRVDAAVDAVRQLAE